MPEACKGIRIGLSQHRLNILEGSTSHYGAGRNNGTHPIEDCRECGIGVVQIKHLFLKGNSLYRYR
jgi:hypothetical protein